MPVAVLKEVGNDPFGSHLDGLLGMSFLARFKVTLTQGGVELRAILILVSRWRETSHEAFLGAPVVACHYLADKAMSAFMSAIGGKADMAKTGRHVA